MTNGLRCVIGVDGGGSKTACVIATEGGTRLGQATGGPCNYQTIAGTGSIAFGQNRRGEQRRAGGWGYILGDEGSGHAMGLAALRAVCRAADGRGPATALTEIILSAHNLADASALVGLTYRRWGVADVAAPSPAI